MGGRRRAPTRGEADLAAVGVAGEHEIDKRSATVAEDVVDVVWLVRHEDDGAVWLFRDGAIEPGDFGAGVVDAAEPEALAAALDGDVAVDENGDAVGGESVGDDGGADDGVVVAEDGIAQRAGEVAEDLAAAVGFALAEAEGQRAAADEVSGEDDHVGGERVDMVDDAFHKARFGELVEVDVADLCDAEAVKGLRQIAEGDGAVDDVDLVAGDLAGVEGEGGCGGSCAEKESAAGDS